MSGQRTRRDRLSPDQTSRLESLPDWVWDTLVAAWEESFTALEKYVEREGHARVPKSYIEDGFRLGAWVSGQRSRRDRLSPERTSKLECLSGWVWVAREAAWEEGFAALGKYVKREGDARVPLSYMENGFRLGQWVSGRRSAKTAGSLSPERVSKLESLTGWAWDINDAAWEEGFAALERYAARENHALVPSSHIEDDFNLGVWVLSQRGGKERLSPEQISRLESFPAWSWNTRETAWEEGFAALEKYVRREGHARVPISHRESGFRLGGWVSVQRSTNKGKGLSPDRISRLETLPGWVWDAS